MKALVTGVAGQLGHDVMNELAKRNIAGVGTDLKEVYSGVMDGTPVTTMPYIPMDITDPESVRKGIIDTGVDFVIHCAAWTAVDKAEEMPEACRKVNAYGTLNIAKVCEELDIPMMYFSTDYVFNGNGTRPWEPEDAYEPLVNGKNFIKTMLNLAKNHTTLRVVNDQIGTPTYTYDLARLVVDMALTDKYGIYHVTNEGDYISWYDFACAIFKEAGITSVEVIPVTSEEYGAAAKRPYNSRMDRSKIVKEGFEPLPDWRDALKRYVAILREM